MRAQSLWDAVADTDTTQPFEYMLFGLMLKADSYNLDKLAKQWPIEAQMVRIFHKRCPLTEIDNEPEHPDFPEIERMAIEELKEPQHTFNRE